MKNSKTSPKAAVSNTATKEATKAATTKEAVPTKSAYGTTIEVVCGNPDASKQEILKQVKSSGIDIEAHKNAVQTGISQAKKIIDLLKQNGWSK